MPDDRFLHKALGHSRKVNGLTSDEFRVWVQYQLSADDFGVMLFSSRPLRADNDYLDGKPTKTVQRWLERVRDIGLLLTFEHQEQLYCCQWDWQDWQGVEYPRSTVHPKPPVDILAQCDDATRLLFSVHPGGVRAPSLKSRKELAEDSPNARQPFGHLAGARAQTANTKAEAEALKVKEGGLGETVDPVVRVRQFIDQYRALHQEHVGVAYMGNPQTDYREACALVEVFDDLMLEKLTVYWLNDQDKFAKDGTRTVAKMRSRVSKYAEELKAKRLA